MLALEAKGNSSKVELGGLNEVENGWQTQKVSDAPHGLIELMNEAGTDMTWD
jgi:hypothetical protein